MFEIKKNGKEYKSCTECRARRKALYHGAHPKIMTGIRRSANQYTGPNKDFFGDDPKYLELNKMPLDKIGEWYDRLR